MSSISLMYDTSKYPSLKEFYIYELKNDEYKKDALIEKNQEDAFRVFSEFKDRYGLRKLRKYCKENDLALFRDIDDILLEMKNAKKN